MIGDRVQSRFYQEKIPKAESIKVLMALNKEFKIFKERNELVGNLEF
jgi:hypothetical protein